MIDESTVLLVDDEPAEAEFYEEYLGRSGDIVPVTALSGDEALGTLRRGDIDCLVSDSVETSEGRSLVEVAKEEYPELPVLLYSGHERDEVPADVADAYLKKGVASDTGTVLQTLSETIHDLTIRGKRSDAPLQSGGASEWSHLGTIGHDREDNVSMAIVESLVEATDVDLIDAAPLYETVDPDALEQLVKHAMNSAHGDRLLIEFTFAGHAIRVFGDGDLEYRKLDSEEFGSTDSVVQ